jgi:hypothetical protein
MGTAMTCRPMIAMASSASASRIAAKTSAHVSDAAALSRSARASARSARRSACMRPSEARTASKRLLPAATAAFSMRPAPNRRIRSIVGCAYSDSQASMAR